MGTQIILSVYRMYLIAKACIAGGGGGGGAGAGAGAGSAGGGILPLL